jgi:hypothetical protein
MKEIPLQKKLRKIPQLILFLLKIAKKVDLDEDQTLL